MRGGIFTKKKKRQLVGGILLMVLGLGVSVGSVAFRYVERGGLGAFHAGSSIVNRHGINGNYGFQNPRQKGFNQSPNFRNRNQNQNNQNETQTPNPPATQNQAPN
ncbi:hypothetical protein [Desulfitobacterium sp.]|uniref:hypothetical protein n=1 Tax=Desulfitobacterium sp. TaxID=49981 RepID=UPI002D03A7C4|nr:hypothetical protein [Desulfitobacterium sp.]HVJ47595.1 hypothetical protein [Desulfitobacterium sp.]